MERARGRRPAQTEPEEAKEQEKKKKGKKSAYRMGKKDCSASNQPHFGPEKPGVHTVPAGFVGVAIDRRRQRNSLARLARSLRSPLSRVM